MATSTPKLVLNGARDIPFNKLVPSAANVRKVKAGVSIEELAEDIGRRGLLQSLQVRPVLDGAGVETGLFEVTVGGRRLQALQRLVKAKRLAKTQGVPCVVQTDHGTAAEEDSLAENASAHRRIRWTSFARSGRCARSADYRMRRSRPRSSFRPRS